MLHPPRSQPANPFPSAAAALPLRPAGAARGHGGAGPRPACGREGGVERSLVRPPASLQPLGRELREGALPRMLLDSRLPRPLLPTTLGPARLGPDRPETDLKVPLSSRSIGGAAARCLL